MHQQNRSRQPPALQPELPSFHSGVMRIENVGESKWWDFAEKTSLIPDR